MSDSLTQRLKLRKFIKNLQQFRGRHTELVSVYVPAGYDLTKIINSLQDEQGTATNIKDQKTSKSVISALERMIQTLKVIAKTPERGLAIFSGNISEKDNVQNFQVFWIEPADEVNLKLYRCDQKFITYPLEEMDANDTTYGLIAIDKGEATVGLLVGSSIKVVRNLNSTVPGKFRTGGQCHPFGTLIQKSNGELIKIEDLSVGDELRSMNFETLQHENSKVLDTWNVTKDSYIRITTKYPQLKIDASKDHLFFVKTPNGIIEKAAENLNEEDILLMPEMIEIPGKNQLLNSKKYYNAFSISEEGRKLLKNKRSIKNELQRETARKLKLAQTTISSYEIGKINAKSGHLNRICHYYDIDYDEFLNNYCSPIFTKGSKILLPSKVTKELAQFLGYYIGDGCVEVDRISFFEQRKEVALKYKKKFDNYFNLNSSYTFRESKNYHQLRFVSRPLVRLIQHEFPEIKKTQDSRIPSKILKANNDVVAGFIRGIFDAEGYFTGGSLGIATINKTLIQELWYVLMRFSIIASFQKHDTRSNPYSDKPIYKLQINDYESIENFKKYIGFTSSEKNELVETFLTKEYCKSKVRQLFNHGTEIRSIIEENGKKMSDYKNISEFFRNKKMISKRIFSNTFLSEGSSHLNTQFQKILKYNVLPTKISKIERVNKNQDMVDISVENKNFIANGLVVHNSAQRFERIREGAAIEFYKRVADIAIQEFTFMKELKGIIVGGPGTTKNNFVDGNYMNETIKGKVLGIFDITYTNAFGLKELFDKAQDLLQDSEVMTERKTLQKFFEKLSKDTSMIVYGLDATKQALEMGAVEDLIVIDTCIADNDLDELSAIAENYKTSIHLVTDKTPEGTSYKGLSGIGGILRYPIVS